MEFQLLHFIVFVTAVDKAIYWEKGCKLRKNCEKSCQRKIEIKFSALYLVQLSVNPF